MKNLNFFKQYSNLHFSWILISGNLLRTAVIRPDTFYGELDKLFVTTSIEAASVTFGYLPYIGSGVQPNSYVGNTAWGHVKVYVLIFRLSLKYRLCRV